MVGFVEGFAENKHAFWRIFPSPGESALTSLWLLFTSSAVKPAKKF